MVAPAHAQVWSEPFNHNEKFNGNDGYTHPYSPWTTLGPASAAPPNTVLQPVSGQFAPIDGIFDPTIPVISNVFLPGRRWPRPTVAGDRSFNAIHMGVIPKGPYRGMVLVCNDSTVVAARQPPLAGIPALQGGDVQGYQAYAIIDPAEAPANGVRYRNFLTPIGDPYPFATLLTHTMFCAGHCWSPFGDLLVFGGTDATNLTTFSGNTLAYVFNPRRPCYWPVLSPTELYPSSGMFTAGNYAGLWTRAPDLVIPRWYPTATLTHRLARGTGTTAFKERVICAGGIETIPAATVDHAELTYEAYAVLGEANLMVSNLAPDVALTGVLDPNIAATITAPADQNRVFNGPGYSLSGPYPFLNPLGEYPRIHLLSTGLLFCSGYAAHGAWLNHDLNPGIWTRVANQPAQPPGTYSSNWQFQRHDGSAVLFPNLGDNRDGIVRIGGARDFAGPTTDTMESIAAGANGTWVAGPAMPVAAAAVADGGRVFMNTVILPTGGLLVLGGQHQGTTNTPIYEPILFEDGVWQMLPPNPTASRRTYHSTAVLLPDGRVFLGGGNDREYDYEIFSPSYLKDPNDRPVNPVWQTPVPPLDPTYDALVLDRNSQYTVHFDPLPLGQSITKAVLMAPCSTTHHSDMHQRYVELKTGVTNGNQVTFATDRPEAVVPRGIYMLFFVSNASVSEAIWVMFQ